MNMHKAFVASHTCTSCSMLRNVMRYKWDLLPLEEARQRRCHKR